MVSAYFFTQLCQEMDLHLQMLFTLTLDYSQYYSNQSQEGKRYFESLHIPFSSFI